MPPRARIRFLPGGPWRADANVAQWQSTPPVRERLRVRLPSLACYMVEVVPVSHYKTRRPPEGVDLVVTETSGRVSDRPDYVGFLHKEDMDQAGIKDGSYVMISNRVRTADGVVDIRLAVLVFEMTSEILQQLRPEVSAGFKKGMIAMDQTYRDALGAASGTTVSLVRALSNSSVAERLTNVMRFQRVIMRANLNHTYLERRVPMAGVCEEMTTAVGVQYGDKVIVSSPDNTKSIAMICAPLTPSMQEFHDATTRIQGYSKVDTWIDAKEEDGVPDVSKVVDRIHPIFIDATNRRALGIDIHSPVRIRRSFRWLLLKKLSKVSSMNLLALPIMMTYLQQDITNPVLWAVMAGMGGWLVWGILKSTTYNTKVAEL